MRQPLTSLTFGNKIPHRSQFVVYTPADQIPPFQISRPQNAHGLADLTIEAISSSGNVIDIKAMIDLAAGDTMRIVTFTDGTDVIIYPQLYPLMSVIDGGVYYIKVSDSINTWYSRYMLKVTCGSIVPYPPAPSDWWAVYENTISS